MKVITFAAKIALLLVALLAVVAIAFPQDLENNRERAVYKRDSTTGSKVSTTTSKSGASSTTSKRTKPKTAPQQSTQSKSSASSTTAKSTGSQTSSTTQKSSGSQTSSTTQKSSGPQTSSTTQKSTSTSSASSGSSTSSGFSTSSGSSTSSEPSTSSGSATSSGSSTSVTKSSGTSTSASTTTTTAPPCPSSTSALCSGASSKPTTCSSESGQNYVLNCGVEFIGTIIHTPARIKRDSPDATVATCQALCESFSNCVALNFLNQECTVLSAVTAVELVPGALAAAKAGDVPAVTALPLTSTTSGSSSGTTSSSSSSSKTSGSTVSSTSVSSTSTSATSGTSKSTSSSISNSGSTTSSGSSTGTSKSSTSTTSSSTTPSPSPTSSSVCASGKTAACCVSTLGQAGQLPTCNNAPSGSDLTATSFISACLANSQVAACCDNLENVAGNELGTECERVSSTSTSTSTTTSASPSPTSVCASSQTAACCVSTLGQAGQLPKCDNAPSGSDASAAGFTLACLAESRIAACCDYFENVAGNNLGIGCARYTPPSPTSSTTSLPPGPTNTLIPVAAPDANSTDPDSLIPVSSSALYYAEQSYLSNPYLKMIVRMDVNFTYPTVVIENTDLVHDETCFPISSTNSDLASQEVVLGFNSPAVLDIINKYWVPLSQMVLVINGNACYNPLLPAESIGETIPANAGFNSVKPSVNNTRAYWLGRVSSVNSSSDITGNMAVTFVGDELALEEGITSGYLQWGSTGAPETPPAAPFVSNNTDLCRSYFDPPARNVPPGLPFVNPCTDNFDEELDQAAGGALYVPSLYRQGNLSEAMLAAQAHPAAVKLYFASVSANPTKRKREPSLPQMTAPPRIHAAALRPRGIDWGAVAHAFEDAGHDIASLFDDAEAAGSTAINGFSSAVSAFEASAGTALASVTSAIESFVANAGTEIADALEAVATDVAALTKQFGTIVENTAEEVANDLGTFGPQGSGTLHLDLAPGDKADSPWGKAEQLYKSPKSSSGGSLPSGTSTTSTSTSRTDTSTRHSSTSTSSSSSASATASSNVDKSVTAYCVGCGLTGTLQYSGAARFSIADGVQELNFAMEGPLKFTIGLGVEAEIIYTMPTLTYALVPPQSIPVLEIEGVINIGPTFELDATLDLTITGEGAAIAGVVVEVPNFSSNVDFVDTANSYVKGFDSLTTSPYFAAMGELGAVSTIGMPMSVGIGIVLLDGKFDKQIKLVNTPSITANAVFEAQYSAGSGAPSTGPQTCPNGFTWDITYADEFDLNLLGLYTDHLYSYQSPPVIQECYQIPGTQSQDRRDIAVRQSTSNSTTAGPFPSNFPQSTYTGAGVSVSNITTQNASTSYTSSGTQLSVGNLKVVSASDGNLYLQSASTSTLFQTIGTTSSNWVDTAQQISFGSSEALVTDDQDRGFFLFRDTFASWGVSRIRMYAVGQAPANAFQTVFAPGDVSGGKGVNAYFFPDPTDPVPAFYPVACLIQNAAGNTYTQLFAVNNVADGIAGLVANDPSFTAAVVGGIVLPGGCTYLQLIGTPESPQITALTNLINQIQSQVDSTPNGSFL